MSKILPLLTLTGCLVTHSDLTEEQEAHCQPQIEALEQSCEAQNGTFKKTVDDARLCLGEQVRILCQDPGPFEPKILTIQK